MAALSLEVLRAELKGTLKEQLDIFARGPLRTELSNLNGVMRVDSLRSDMGNDSDFDFSPRGESDSSIFLQAAVPIFEAPPTASRRKTVNAGHVGALVKAPPPLVDRSTSAPPTELHNSGTGNQICTISELPGMAAETADARQRKPFDCGFVDDNESPVSLSEQSAEFKPRSAPLSQQPLFEESVVERQEHEPPDEQADLPDQLFPSELRLPGTAKVFSSKAITGMMKRKSSLSRQQPSLKRQSSVMSSNFRPSKSSSMASSRMSLSWRGLGSQGSFASRASNKSTLTSSRSMTSSRITFAPVNPIPEARPGRKTLRPLGSMESLESDFPWIAWCGDIVEHPYFDLVISALIIANGLSIGAQTDYMARNLVMEAPKLFRGIEIFFCISFLLELLVRVGAYGRDFLRGPDRWWNLFDTVVVGLQIFEEIVSLISFLHPRESALAKNFSSMRILRVLRLIRIVRLVRVLRLIGELRTIVTSIASSLKHLLWTVLLLLLIIYTVATYLTQLVLDTRLANPDLDYPDLARWWDSIGRSCLTLFQVITNGNDWDTNVIPLMEHISVLLAPCFCLYIAFAILALMNVVTGVFVENAIETANKDKEKYLVRTAQEVFARADPMGTGVVTWAEFERQLEGPELQGYFQGLGVDTKCAKGLFKILDIDNSGEIDSNELLTGTLRLRGAAKAIDLAALIYESRCMGRRLQAVQRSVLKCLGKLDSKIDSKVDGLRRSFLDRDSVRKTSLG